MWGPRGWRWLHSLAISFPRNPTARDRALARKQLADFIEKLPCKECRAHSAKYFADSPPDLTNSGTFQVWAWKFHNDVNKRLGKPLLPLSAYQQMYLIEMCWAGQPVDCSRMFD